MNEYTFFVLPYVHDAVTQEFANVGIVLYSERQQILRSKFTTKYRRLPNMFGGAAGGKCEDSLVVKSAESPRFEIDLGTDAQQGSDNIPVEIVIGPESYPHGCNAGCNAAPYWEGCCGSTLRNKP